MADHLPPMNGLSLSQYVETRFNLITELIKDRVANLLAKIEAMQDVIDERDRLYKERDESRRVAVDAALTAVKEQTKASFDASEKAIVKSDVNADKWRENANEWRAAMMDRESKFASRSETEAEFRSLRAELSNLRESRERMLGRGAGGQAMWGYVAAAIGILFAAIALAMRLGGAP